MSSGLREPDEKTVKDQQSAPGHHLFGDRDHRSGACTARNEPPSWRSGHLHHRRRACRGRSAVSDHRAALSSRSQVSACPVADPDPAKGSSRAKRATPAEKHDRRRAKGRVPRPIRHTVVCPPQPRLGLSSGDLAGLGPDGPPRRLALRRRCGVRTHHAAVFFAILALLAIGYSSVARLTTRAL